MPGRGHILSFKHKYSYEEKEKILLEYQTGVHGFRELCRVCNLRRPAATGAVTSGHSADLKRPLVKARF